MPTFADALKKLASVLLDPKSQKPTLDQRFTHLAFEFQNFYNELTNSHQPWTHSTLVVNVSSGIQDYMVPGNVGTILFAYANPTNGITGPVGFEVSDLANVSSDFYLFSPLDFGISRDFNEAFAVPFPNQIAFYRNASGALYFRLAPFGTNIESVSLVYSTGDWIDNLDPSVTPVLSQYHALPVIRAAQSLLPGCEWPDGRELGPVLAASLLAQERRHAQQFILAKRSMTGDGEESYRTPVGGDW